MIDKLEI